MSEQESQRSSIQIQVNGKSQRVPVDCSVEQLLKLLGVSVPGIAVELSGEILSPNRYASTRLKDGHVLELVRLVGGG